MKRNNQTVRWSYEHWLLSSLVKDEKWSILHFKPVYTRISVREQVSLMVIHKFAPDPPHGIGEWI